MVSIRPFALALEVFSHDAVLNRTPFFSFKTITKCCFIQLETKPNIQVSNPTLTQYQPKSDTSKPKSQKNHSYSTNLSLVSQELSSSRVRRIELVTSGEPSSSSAKPRWRLLRICQFDTCWGLQNDLRVACVSVAQDRSEAVEASIWHDSPELLNL